MPRAEGRGKGEGCAKVVGMLLVEALPIDGGVWEAGPGENEWREMSGRLMEEDEGRIPTGPPAPDVRRMSFPSLLGAVGPTSIMSVASPTCQLRISAGYNHT